jgi:Multicopper oxidase
MRTPVVSRRRFLTGTGALVGAELAGASLQFPFSVFSPGSQDQTRADYTLHIKTSPIEIAPKRILSAIAYRGQFPGPLLRFQGRQITVDIYNDTDTPEQLHWHSQKVSVDVDGAAEEGTPFIPAHGKRRIAFTPSAAGSRFYHPHNRAGAPWHLMHATHKACTQVHEALRRQISNRNHNVGLVGSFGELSDIVSGPFSGHFANKTINTGLSFLSDIRSTCRPCWRWEEIGRWLRRSAAHASNGPAGSHRTTVVLHRLRKKPRLASLQQRAAVPAPADSVRHRHS